MAKNPMQRKAQNAFLLGIFITILITGAIIAFLFVQLNKVKDDLKQYQANIIDICVLNSNITSGQLITQDMVTQKKVDKRTVPADAVGTVSSLQTYAVETIDGLEVTTNEEGELVVPDIDSNTGEQIEKNGEKQFKVIVPEGDTYYYQEIEEVTRADGTVEQIKRRGAEVKLVNVPMIAKVDMQANTILTNSMMVKSSDRITDDVREVEYNMFSLASQIENEQYVDLRLRLPDGTDYIVATHKMVDIPNIEGVDSSTTVRFNVNEVEILTINCAIVESYQIEGSRLYVTKYVEPGSQEAAKETYVPSATVRNLIITDPNCVDVAKNSLYARLYQPGTNNLTTNATEQRRPVDSALITNQEDGPDNAIDKIEEEITKMQEERKQYLESLGA